MLSGYESYYIDDDSDNDGSEFRSAGTCTFTFCFRYFIGRVDNPVDCVDNYVGRICGVGYGIFIPIGIESIGDVVLLAVCVPIEADSKGDQLIEIFWCPKSLFYLQF